MRTSCSKKFSGSPGGGGGGIRQEEGAEDAVSLVGRGGEI